MPKLDNDYPERKVELLQDRKFIFGEGRISGYLSVTLGVLSFIAVLAFQFPSQLTTYELRAAYDAKFLQSILMYAMYLSLGFGLLTFILAGSRRKGAVGILFTMLGFACGGYTVEIGPVEPSTLAIGIDWLILAFVISAILFIFLEKVFPKYKDQIILRKEWKLDLFYFCQNHLLITVLLLAANHFVINGFGWAVSLDFQSFIQKQHIAVQVILLIICADFVLYWTHRIFHKVPRLWRFHAIHHSVEDMDWMAGSRTHILQTFVDRCLVLVPLYLLGTSKEALDLYISLAAFQAVYIHANIDIPVGPLKYLVVTPQYHHWHHSSQKPALDTNFAAHLPLFDKLFGTYHMPVDHWPARYGTTSPLPRNFVSQFLYPFKKRKSNRRNSVPKPDNIKTCKSHKKSV